VPLRRSEPAPVAELLVRYSAQEMPVNAIVEIQHETLKDHANGDVTTKDALRIVTLLLTISLQKLTA
jgi:hypothetical protein